MRIKAKKKNKAQKKESNAGTPADICAPMFIAT